MKNYQSPLLTEYGDITDITAIAGGAFSGDFAYDLNGEVILTGNQSIDLDPCGPGTNDPECND